MADFEGRDPTDWEGIERSSDFQALVAGRRRFVALAGGGTVGLTVAYILVAYLAPDVLGTALGWAGGVGLIVLTWIVTLAYLRRSDREWSPLEQRIVASAREPSRRFARDDARVEEEVR
jgi:uncharacterized membrane protein (DUF485 family)